MNIKKKWFSLSLTGFHSTIWILLLSGCFKEVELYHPDDPFSNYYIYSNGNSCDSARHERINLNTAEIYWIWSDSSKKTIQSSADEIIIERFYLMQNDTIIDTSFLLPKNSMNSNSDTTGYCAGDTSYSFIDSTLIIETDYLYKIWVSNEYGQAKDYIVINYSHEFNKIDSLTLSQVYSDTSVICKWGGTDSIQDSIKLVWKYAGNDSILDIVIIDGDLEEAELINTKVILDTLTQIEFYYGALVNNTMIWQRNIMTDTLTLSFEKVNDLLVIPFQKGINRLTWRYDSEKIKPDSFVVILSSEDSITIPNAYTLTQVIGGLRYFVHYDKNPYDTQTFYSIYPKTTRNKGSRTMVDCRRNDVLEDYCYIDSGDDIGFYIGLFEMTVGEFIGIFNDQGWSPSYFFNNSSGWGGIIDSSNSGELVLDSVSFENHPIERLTWSLADSTAMVTGGRLPSHEEWKWAARAFSQDNRQYPWGNDDPENRCNYSSTGTVPVESMESGRVDIYLFQQIKGPFHMSGNVEEWVADSFTIRNNESRLVKGGKWSDNDTHWLLIETDSRKYTNVDAVGGLRIIKEFY